MSCRSSLYESLGDARPLSQQHGWAISAAWLDHGLDQRCCCALHARGCKRTHTTIQFIRSVCILMAAQAAWDWP